MTSSVDRARAVLGAARRRLHPSRVVFHHAPKCGGTSVGRSLRKRFILSQATVLPEATFAAEAALTPDAGSDDVLLRAEALRERMLLYHLAAGVDCISAHVRFSEAAWQAYSGKVRFITMLRDPEARFLSHYRWSHGRPDGHAHISLPFAAFLDSPAALRLGAYYVYFFSGLPPDANMRSEAALDRAKANLDRFDAVGFLDRIGDFQAAIRQTVGVRLRIGHENRAARPALSDLESHRDRIAALTAPDRAFYAYARQRFADGLARAG